MANKKPQIKKTTKSDKPQVCYASKLDKTKAFLLDNFMILMPIMYIVFYLFLGSREAFSAHKIEGWIAITIPLVLVQIVLFYKLGQTPGYKAYNLQLIDEATRKKPTLFAICFRVLGSILSFFTVFGWMMMYFRKDSKTLHDLLSNTSVIYK